MMKMRIYLRPIVPSILLVLALASTASGQYLEATIPVGDCPYGILWNPVSDKVYCSNSQDGTVTIISGGTNQVIATVEVPDYPNVFAWNSRENKVYCASGESNRLAVIDGVGDTLLATLRLHEYPGIMTYNPEMNKLYVACHDNGLVYVVDAGPDTVLTMLTIGDGGSMGLAWHPLTNRLFCSLGYQDSVKVLDCETDEVVEALATWDLPGAWCYNPVNDLMYLTTRLGVHVLTPTGDSIVASVAGCPFGICHVPFANKLYVSSVPGIFVVDGATHEIGDTILGVGGSLLCDTDRGRAYARSSNDGVHILDARADTLIKTIPLGRQPFSLCWNRTASRVYITDELDNVVYVIRDTTTGIAETGLPGRPRAAVLEARPNPFAASTLVRCPDGACAHGPLRVFAQDGRIVRTLSGSGCWHWDGRDDHGRPVSAGVYLLCTTETAGALPVVKTQ